MFVKDLLLKRIDAAAQHQVVAIGTSSQEKGQEFIKRASSFNAQDYPRIYTTYHDLYNDPDVDVVYVGTLHSCHMRNCLDAIAAGKHVLCEKQFAINAKEAQAVISAARARGVFIIEVVWARFFPLIPSLQDQLHSTQSIGRINRMFADFGLAVDLETLSADSRLASLEMGAGALLDVGFYSIMWASLVMGNGMLGQDHPHHKLRSVSSLINGIDESNVVFLTYFDDHGAQTAVCTSTLRNRSAQDFCRIEGTKGVITVFGPGGSRPAGYRVLAFGEGAEEDKETTFTFEREGLGFYLEADAVAECIRAGELESSIVPLDEMSTNIPEYQRIYPNISKYRMKYRTGLKHLPL